MKKSFLRIGCWLIGYNWSILACCSEVSATKVRKYTSALLVILLLWFGVGFIFSARYLQLNLVYSLFGSILLCIIVVNLERTIILSTQNTWLYFFRGFLAIVMAIIGSIIVDQAILKADINSKRALIINERANKVLSDRTTDLRNSNEAVKSEITKAQIEKNRIAENLSKHPTVILNKIRKELVSDIMGNNGSHTKLTSESIETENPDAKFLTLIDDRIKDLQNDVKQNSQEIEQIHAAIMEDLRQNLGFLDEINIMISILKESAVALIVYLLWLGFLLALETLVLITKLSGEKTDYDDRLEAQMKLHRQKIQAYQNGSSESLLPHLK